MNWLQKIEYITANKSNQLQAIVDKWDAAIPGLHLYVYENERRIILSNIIIPKDQRKKGLGSQIIQDIANYADQIGKRIELTPGLKDKHHGTTSRSRLINFYKRFDFVQNKGRNKDYSTSEGMFRRPQNNNI